MRCRVQWCCHPFEHRQEIKTSKYVSLSHANKRGLMYAWKRSCTFIVVVGNIVLRGRAARKRSQRTSLSRRTAMVMVVENKVVCLAGVCSLLPTTMTSLSSPTTTTTTSSAPSPFLATSGGYLYSVSSLGCHRRHPHTCA